MLAGYGVTHVFMVPAILRQTLVEMERRTSIDRVACHGEKAAAYMADGYARVSGKPGICLAQHIGGLNLAAGLRDAWLAGAPLIAITGGNDPKTKYRKVYQEVDDLAAFDSITKWNAAVDSAERIPEMLRQAFRIAVTGNPGPVHLRFRGNEGQLDAEETHPDVSCEPQFARAPAWRPQPRVEDVDRALALLATAERPVFVAGGGARSSGAGEALVALAKPSTCRWPRP
jgi:acetolactate synthase-1/2/3 large subunit